MNAESLQLDPPHQIEAAIVQSYGFFVWRIDGKPEVWRRVPFKKKTEKSDAVPQHWQRFLTIGSIPRVDAMQELASAWKQDCEWREAYAGKS